MATVRCEECGRPLSNPLSVAAGHGPTCSRYVLGDARSVRARSQPISAADPARWRHLFDACNQCEQLTRPYLPFRYLGNGPKGSASCGCFSYRCDRGHWWTCWFNVAEAETFRFSDCPCVDCRDYYGSAWRELTWDSNGYVSSE